MKLKLSFILALSSMLSWAQYAPSYYDEIDFSQNGDQLKSQLASLISTTHKKSINYSELKDLLPSSDVDPTNSNNIILFYGSESSGTHQRSRSKGGTWNREHVYPKSKGTPNLGQSGPGADAHHLRPTDNSLNSQRSSTPFADGFGSKAGNMNGGWYPGDEWKGDVARIILYMYTRYADRAKPNAVGVGVGTNKYHPEIPDIFLKWNAEDPISDIEIYRNKVVSEVQGNSNPFIDNPYLATVIWGGPEAENTWPSEFDTTPDTDKPSIPTNLIISDITSSTASLSWTKSTDNRGISGYDVYINGNLKGSSSSTTYTISALKPLTAYEVYVVAKDRAGNISENSLTTNFTTTEVDDTNPNPGTPGGSCGTEDFEKIPANASGYALRQWTNNGISWSAEKARTDQTINNRAITLNEGKALKSSTIDSGIGNLTITFKNPFSTDSNLNIKVVYTEDGQAKEKLYTYKVTSTTKTETMSFNIHQPFTFEISTVETSEKNRVSIDDLTWDCYTLSTNEVAKNTSLKVYPNPIKNQEFVIDGLKNSETVNVYSMTGQLVQTFNNVQNKQQLSLKKLPKGIYIVKTTTSSTKVIVE